MKVAVITGSTRGIGFGLARELLRRDCGIVISGRKADTVGWAVAELGAEFGANCIFGQVCDVTDFASIQSLWDTAAKRFGKIDIWINNAGISHRQIDLAVLPADDQQNIVKTNILGTIYGASVAMRGMRAQGKGAIYNLEGLGSDGRHIRGLSLYGATKYAVTYLTDALAEEAKGSGVIVGAIRPGMVLTELISSQYTGRDEDWRRMQRVFRIIASEVKDVTPWVAERVLANRRNGVRIQYATVWRMAGRMIKNLGGTKKE